MASSARGLRGLPGARDEFHLAAMVQNLTAVALRLFASRPEPAPAITPTQSGAVI
jgi:hypothetical protein